MNAQEVARLILDMGARWFDVRASIREREGPQLHAHWSPVSRSWQYHVHSEEDEAAAPRQ